jgi:hypothetical protein
MNFSRLTKFTTTNLGSDVYIIPGAWATDRQRTLLITDIRAVKIRARWTFKNPFKGEAGDTGKMNDGGPGPYPENRWLEISAAIYSDPKKVDRIVDQNGDNYEIVNVRPEYGGNVLAKNWVTCRILDAKSNRYT